MMMNFPTAVAAPGIAASGVQWFSLPGEPEIPAWLMGGFSTRRGGLSHAYCAADAPGELNLGLTAHDDPATVRANRKLFAEAVSGDAATPLITLRQIHSCQIVKAERGDAAREPLPEGDGLITDQTGVLLGMQTADCIPVLVADLRRRAVGAFHAGWRGTVQGIAAAGVAQMRQWYGCDPAEMLAFIGPGIGLCCYTVGEEVRAAFAERFGYAAELFRNAEDSASAPRLHLREANRRQLLDAGLRPEAIALVGGCTLCERDLFFSHRGEQGRTGRMLSVIGIRAGERR
jgi:hypothetical protein